jgi:hypothetical protein
LIGLPQHVPRKNGRVERRNDFNCRWYVLTTSSNKFLKDIFLGYGAVFFNPHAAGTHPELVSLMEEIETKKRKRMDTAAAWCRYQQLNYRRQFEGFEYQANVHFIVSQPFCF